MALVVPDIRSRLNSALDEAAGAIHYRDLFFSLLTLAEDFNEHVLACKLFPLII